MLEVEKVKKSFGKIKVLSNCSFSVKKHSIMAILGLNGSGKTTLFNIISGVENADSGQIKINKEIITNKSIEFIAKKYVSKVFQKSSLFNSLSVKENLEIAVRGNRKSIWKYFNKDSDRDEDIEDVIGRLSLNNILNKKCSELSFGKKRLVELGRAVLSPHKILIADEPLAGLDEDSRNNVYNFFLHLKKCKETILFSDHDLSFVLKISDLIVVLNQGEVIICDTPDKIKNNKFVTDNYIF